MSNEFNPQKLLEDIESGILELGQPTTEPTSWIGMNPTYGPTDGTTMKVDCNCSGWGGDKVCSDDSSECVRTFKLEVEHTGVIIHSETFKWTLPGCHSCLKKESSKADIIKDSGNFYAEVDLCTDDGCSEIMIPLPSEGMPTEASAADSTFKVNVELVPMNPEEILATAEQEGDVANAFWPEDTDLITEAHGLELSKEDMENLGL